MDIKSNKMIPKKPGVETRGYGTCTPKGAVIPDWKLERFILEELPQSELNAIREQELSDVNLHERIESLRKDNALWLEKHPLNRMIREAKQAVSPSLKECEKRFSLRESWKTVPRWAAPAFACAAVLLFLPLYMISSTPQQADPLTLFSEDTRIKGLESRLEVWRRTGGSAEKLGFEAGVSQGDIIQLRYLVPTVCYGTIVSLDGRGVVTVHLSGELGKAAPLTPGRAVALSHSYELDDAPKYEIFYLVTSSQNFDINTVKQSIQKVKDPNKLPVLQSDQQVTVFTLRKHNLI